MRAPNAIKPPDIFGFEYLMRDALEGHEDKAELLEIVEGFCDRFKRLDEWKLKNERAKRWAPMEPCVVHDGPGIVIAVGQIRVSVRAWHVPLRPAEFPLSGRVSWFNPQNLEKVSSQKRWDSWRASMRACGHEPLQWGPPSFEELSR